MLEAVGIDPMHERVFRSVLTTPDRTLGEVAAATELSPCQVEEAVRALEEPGFLTRLENADSCRPGRTPRSRRWPPAAASSSTWPRPQPGR